MLISYVERYPLIHGTVARLHVKIHFLGMDKIVANGIFYTCNSSLSMERKDKISEKVRYLDSWLSNELYWMEHNERIFIIMYAL